MATRLLHPSTHAHPPFVVTESHVNAALLMIGRLLFGGYFAYEGLNHFLNHTLLAGAAAAHGVPQPELAVLGTGLLLIAGGLSVLTGYAPKVGAACLAVFLIGVTPIMHAFWNDTDSLQRMGDMVNFTKNIALLGAVCFMAALAEPWPASAGHGH